MTLFDLPVDATLGRFAIASASALPFRDDSVHCVVTSPPYWKARDYGHGPDQLGNEDRVVDFVDHLVTIFGEVGRVLRPDGTLWVNIGDTYNTRSILRTGAHNAGLGHTDEQVGAVGDDDMGGGVGGSDGPTLRAVGVEPEGQGPAVGPSAVRHRDDRRRLVPAC